MDMNDDRTNPRNPYTTFFHEMGHMIDNTLPELIKGQNTNWWHNPYVSSGYSSYSEDFYNNLITDVGNYRNNYIYDTSKFSSADAAISDELRGARKSEFSDLFGGATDNQVVGSYGHWDSKVLWWTDSYWDFNDKTGKPAENGQYNKEAFAHFTEISIMQDQQDIDDLQRYFPNAYTTYDQMISEMEALLNESRK